MSRLGGSVCGWAMCAALLLPMATSCTWSKEAARTRYFEQGNRYYAQQKYVEAELAYRKALQKDPQFGEAYYRLGQTQLKRGRIARGVTSLRHALLRLPGHKDVRVLLAEIYLTAYAGDSQRPKVLLDEFKSLLKQLNRIAPESYETWRLTGQFAAIEGDPKKAIEQFSKANRAKPHEPEVVIPLAQALLAENQAAEAESLLLELIQKRSNAWGAYDVLYGHYRSKRQVAEAETLIRRKIAVNPAAAGPRLQLAAHHASLQQEPQMKAALDEILHRPKDFPNARLLVGDFYGSLNRWPDALGQYQAGARENSKEKQTYELKSTDAFLAQGKWDEAEACLDAVLKEDPKQPSARATRASLRLRKGSREETNKAVAQFRDLVEQFPENPTLRLGLGRAYVVQGNLNAALRQLREAVKRRTDFVPARLALSEVAIDAKQYKEALQHSEAVLLQNTGNAHARLLRAAALVGLTSYPQARDELLKLLTDYPAMGGAHLQLGLLNIAEQRFPEAEAIFRRIYRPGLSGAQVVRGMAELYASQKKYDKALEVLNDELKRNPAYATEVRQTIAETASRANMLDVAIQQYTQLLPATSRPEQVHYRLSELYYHKGDYPKAIAHMEQAKNTTPDNPGVLLVLGSLLDMQAKPQEAQKLYRQVLTAEPENPVAMNNLAYSLAENGGNLDEALKLVQEAAKKMPDQPSISDTVGWIYLKKNMVPAAQRVFENLTVKYPDNPTYRYHLALVLVQTGDKQRARSELGTALAKKPAPLLETKIRQLMDRLS